MKPAINAADYADWDNAAIVSIPLNDEARFADLAQLGRNGEALAFNYLVQNASNLFFHARTTAETKAWEIHWLNRAEEQGRPCDIVCECGEERVFIEVKTTNVADQSIFHISWPELKLAEAFPHHHYVAIVNVNDSTKVKLIFVSKIIEKVHKNVIFKCAPHSSSIYSSYVSFHSILHQKSVNR